MSAAQEIGSIKKLGIIAGGGDLPALVAASCKAQGIEVFIVGYKGQTNLELLSSYPHLLTDLGRAGEVIQTFKKQGFSDLVLIGSIERPGLLALRPDLKGAEIITRLGWKAMGDNDLLVALKKELEREGFYIHGAQAFVENMLMPEGEIGICKPSEEDWVDISRGVQVTQSLGALDVGQSDIVQHGMVLGVEAIEGTDALIKRCASLKKSGKGGVLVKTCKPQQDKDLDLPTIGVETIQHAHEAGLSGIAVHAGKAFLLDGQEVAKTADAYKMFVIGISDEFIEF